MVCGFVPEQQGSRVMVEQAEVEVTIWTDAPQAATVGAVLERMREDVRPIGVGGPRAQAVAALAGGLGCGQWDDLRQLVVERPAGFLLLASMAGAGVTELLAAAAQGTTVLALEPPATSLQALASLRGGGRAQPVSPMGGGGIVFVPAFRQCPGFVSAAEPFEAIGDRRMVAHESVGRAGQGSLFARLFDAWRTVLRFTQTPESVDAALVGASGLDVTPEELRELTGAMTAHARMPDGSAAVLHVADRAADARRGLHVLGGEGELRISDAGYGLWQCDGELIDQDEPDATLEHAELIAHHWRRLIERPAAGAAADPPGAPGEADALACCLACLLSARTAQPESPGRVLQMNR